jgi:hypothetical protein
MRALPCINTAPPASVTRDVAVAEQKMAHAATEPLTTIARYHTHLSCYECTDGCIFMQASPHFAPVLSDLRAYPSMLTFQDGAYTKINVTHRAVDTDPA